MKVYDIVMIGHVARDVVVYRGEEEKSTGGAVVSSSAAAKRSGASVLVVTRVSASDREMLEPLLEDGIDVTILDSPHTTSIRHVYGSEDRERRTVSLLQQAAPFTLNELPEVKARIYHLAGLYRGEMPPALIPPLARRGRVALDAQGIVRTSEEGSLVFRDWDKKEEFLPRVSYLKTDAAEAEILTGVTDLEESSRLLRQMGAGEVMITHGEGVLLHTENGIQRVPFTAGNLTGRTGRGDTCFGAYLAWRLSHSAEESLRYAAALTSIKMETPGVFRGSIQEVRRRMEKP